MSADKETPLDGACSSPGRIAHICDQFDSLDPAAPLGLMLNMAEHTARAQAVLEQVAEGGGDLVLRAVISDLDRASTHLAGAVGAIREMTFNITSYRASFEEGESVLSHDALAGSDTAMSRPGLDREGSHQHGSARAPSRTRKRRRGRGGRSVPDRSTPEPGSSLTFALSHAEFMSGVNTAAAEMAYQLPYNALAAATRRALQRGNTNSFFVPAVRAIANAVLATVHLPSVRDRLPLEIDDRAAVAQHHTSAVTKVLMDGGVFTRFYTENAYLQSFVTDDYLATLTHDAEYIHALGSALFSDVSVVAGGALRILKERYGDIEDASGIIASSTSLAMIAGIPKDKANEALRYLGLPYVASDKLEVREDDQGRPVEVVFTAEATDKIRSYFAPKSGCPARQLKAAEGVI